MKNRPLLPDASRPFSMPIEALELRSLLSISTSFVEVPISAAAIAADPQLANYRSFDLRVALSPGDRMNIVGFDAALSEGQFYRSADSTFTNPALWSSFPQNEFATFVCVDGFGVPSSGVLGYLDNSTILTATRFHPVWGQLGGTTPGATAFTAARVTVSQDAVGSIQGEARSIDLPNVSAWFVNSLPVGAVPLAMVRGAVRAPNGQAHNGFTVYADADRDGVLDAGERSTVTVGASYALVVPVGQYDIRVIPQNGFTSIVQPAGGAHFVTLAASETRASLNFVLAQPALADIEGRIVTDDRATLGFDAPLANTRVYLDLNGNGAFEGTEPNRLSDSLGRYTFAGIAPGTYRVASAPPSAQYAIFQSQPVVIVVLADGQTRTVDFTYHRTDISALRGRVRVDTPGGAGLAGATVYIDANDNALRDPGEQSTVTLEDGNFVFIVAQGNRVVRQTPLGGYSLVSPSSGVYRVTVAGGQAITELDFVNHETQALGRIFGNVSRPAAEAIPGTGNGLANWTVFLDVDNDGVLDAGERRVTTDSSGIYSLDNLPAGQYAVRVNKPSGWRYASSSTPVHAVNLGGGQVIGTRDFVYTQRIMIAGVVFEDKNANGTKDAGENGVRGRRVWVDLNNNAMIDSNEPGGYVGQKGVFGFEDLVAGTYTVRAEEITGWRNVGSGAFTVTLAAGKVKVNVPFGQQKIVLAAGAAPPPARNIGWLSAEKDLTSVWSRL